MNDTPRCLALFVLAVLAVPLVASAEEEAGALKVFKAQTLDLQTRTSDFFSRVGGMKRDAVVAAKQDLLEEGLALQVLVHRTQEETARTQGRYADEKTILRNLLLLTQALESLDYTLGAVEAFIYTGDRLFLGLAKKGQALTQEAVGAL